MSPSHGGADRNLSTRGIASPSDRRPLTGARIETGRGRAPHDRRRVALSRGRGSKQAHPIALSPDQWSPSHGGADRNLGNSRVDPCSRGRPLTGARIETCWAGPSHLWFPRRPLTGARIETSWSFSGRRWYRVALSRGRGSKLLYRRGVSAKDRSPSHGGADRNHHKLAGGLVELRRPLTGARIETELLAPLPSSSAVALSRGRGSKPWLHGAPLPVSAVALSRGRGSKHQRPGQRRHRHRRPPTGARIETIFRTLRHLGGNVALSRGRGSKQRPGRRDAAHEGRPLTGARIETGRCPGSP